MRIEVLLRLRWRLFAPPLWVEMEIRAEGAECAGSEYTMSGFHTWPQRDSYKRTEGREREREIEVRVSQVNTKELRANEA